VYLLLRRCRSSDVLYVSDDGLMIYEVVFFQPLLFRVCTFFSFGADIFLSPTFSFPNLLLFPPPLIYILYSPFLVFTLFILMYRSIV